MILSKVVNYLKEEAFKLLIYLEYLYLMTPKSIYQLPRVLTRG